MKIKDIVKAKVAVIFKEWAELAVEYAESMLGSGTGAAKKEMAIDYVMSKVPLYLTPFKFFIKKALITLADSIIESAVGKFNRMKTELN